MNINLNSARARWIGAALLSLSFGLNGCGGGGSSGPSVSPNPTPTPTPIPSVINATYDKTRYVPNYVNDLEQARKNDPSNPVALLRWDHFPLNVYFERDANYTTTKQALATQGFSRWVTVTGTNGVTYKLTSNADDADITVNFGKFTGGAGDILGQTFYKYDQKSRIFQKGTNIVIKFTGNNKSDLNTAEHEFGHALGINGHSTNPVDLMYYTGNEDYSSTITTSDLDTVLTSYNGYFNKDANARLAPSSGKIISASIQ